MNTNDRTNISLHLDPAQREVMRQAAWDMYAAAALGMAMHPGTTRDAAQPKTTSQIAAIADELIEQRDLRFGRVELNPNNGEQE